MEFSSIQRLFIIPSVINVLHIYLTDVYHPLTFESILAFKFGLLTMITSKLIQHEII
jgi:hypothetical protein